MNSVFTSFTLPLFLVVIWSCFYIVEQTERAVLLQFGRVVNNDVEPGLHIKIPYVQSVQKFDGRLLTLDSQASRFITSEQKALIVDAYAKWKVTNPGVYYQSTSGNDKTANDRLQQRLNSALRDRFGTRTLHEAVAGERDKLMQEVTEGLNKIVPGELGIEVIDVRIKAMDLPETISEDVFNRMRSEREKEAAEHRAKGLEVAAGIKASADREYRLIIAHAYKEAQEIKGKGDAKAANIYGDAYGQDSDFYNFYRSLEVYRESLKSKDDIILLEQDSEFLRFLK